jgi:hypothetical protein
MAAHAAESPSGKVWEVSAEGRERQGAYDLLESGLVDPVALAMIRVARSSSVSEIRAGPGTVSGGTHGPLVFPFLWRLV